MLGLGVYWPEEAQWEVGEMSPETGSALVCLLVDEHILLVASLMDHLVTLFAKTS